jgi:DNA recombination protein Rad52
MRTREKIIAELDKELQENLIATRPSQWGEVSYLESHNVIRQANKIFGFGNWERIITLQPTKVNDGYMAAVKVLVHFPDENGHYRTVTHEDVGYRRIAKARDGSDLEETAIKGSVSDALKRCLRAFGSQFGLGLYDHEDEEESGEAKPARKTNSRPEERRIKAVISSVTKTYGEAKWPYEVEFTTEEEPFSEVLPAYVHKLDQLIRPGDEVVLIITTSKAGNEYIRAVEGFGGEG